MHQWRCVITPAALGGRHCRFKIAGIFTDVDTAHVFIFSQVKVKTLRRLNQQHVSNVSAKNKKTNGYQDYVFNAE